jgi:ribonuclease P protein component
MTAASPNSTFFRRLTKRAQFLNAARGRRAGRTSLALQAIEVGIEEAGIGLTVTKKAGNSPERNRIKRRLRAAVRACGPNFKPQHDYVIVGRREALSAPFEKLVTELNSAIAKVHAGQRDNGTVKA